VPDPPVSQANMGAVINRINQVLRGWTNNFWHAVCKHTLNQLPYFVNGRIIRWLANGIDGGEASSAADSPLPAGHGSHSEPTE